MVAGEALGLRLRRTATSPATWGQAIEVPERTRTAEGDPIQQLVIASPGAKISQQVPKLEKEARISAWLPLASAVV